MYFDRFEIVEAHYAFCSDYHGGQNCPLYARLCRILKYFKPSPMFRGVESLTDNSAEIYKNLEKKHGFAK
jgi:hypothetical protein